MKTVCAWCQKHMDGNKNDSIVSHGICLDCYEAINKELDKEENKRGLI